MIAMSATPLGPFAYIVVFLMTLSFLLGLFAGYFMQPPQLHVKHKERQQIYSTGYQQGYLDNSDNEKAFQQGFTHGYHQGLADAAQPRTPRPATEPMQQEQPLRDPDEPDPDEPVRYEDEHRPAPSARESAAQLVGWLTSGRMP